MVQLRKYADLDRSMTNPASAWQPVTIQVDLDKEKFYEMFVKLDVSADPGRCSLML